jgi:hypothetical protein
MCTDKSGNFVDILGRSALSRSEITTESHQWSGQDPVGVTDRNPDAHLAHVDP